MLPIGDDDRDRRLTPIVTYVLIAANVLFFLLELSSGEAFIERWAFVPSRFLANPTGEFATIFTSMFMHAGWIHLLGNICSALARMYPTLELQVRLLAC